jgi:hypothetical protein
MWEELAAKQVEEKAVATPRTDPSTCHDNTWEPRTHLGILIQVQRTDVSSLGPY